MVGGGGEFSSLGKESFREGGERYSFVRGGKGRKRPLRHIQLEIRFQENLGEGKGSRLSPFSSARQSNSEKEKRRGHRKK